MKLRLAVPRVQPMLLVLLTFDWRSAMVESEQSRVAQRESASAPKATPKEDWAGAIAAKPPSSKREKDEPEQGLFLSFRDPALERVYLQFDYDRSKKIIVAGLFVGTIIMIAFLWVDPLLTPPEHLAMKTSTRLWIAIPAALFGLAGSVLIKDVRLWIPFVSLLVMVGGLWPTVLVWMSSGALFSTSLVGLWNIVIVAFFISGLPLGWAATVSLSFGIAFGACSFAVQLPWDDYVLFLTNFLMIFVFSAFATYRYEHATRRQFVAQGMSEMLAARQLAAESDRRRWLEVIASFLRHELNNAMTAISSSVELADRAVEKAKQEKFLGRARRSTLYMRRLLAQVADATSLESALAQGAHERVNLAGLVRDRMEDFKDDFGDKGLVFVAVLDDGLEVNGNLDALNQMLDKLFNNAMEHGAPGEPVVVELRRMAQACSLVVADQGEALPQDVERLFKPFVSNKTRRIRSGNLGLGLFVARTIASHHGGSITAEPLGDGRVGARFTVSLPLASD